MCRSCGKNRREKRARPVLFEVDCPECGKKALAYNIYSCWCEWCGALLEIKDRQVIRHHTEEQLSIRPSMALRNKGKTDV